MSTLLTGASGFLGQQILQTLTDASIAVTTLGRSPVVNSQNHLTADLAEGQISLPDNHYDKVIHCAGKAHVFPKTEEEVKRFYQVNQYGTQNLLQALTEKKIKPQQFVLISTVAVYGIYHGEGITESHALAPNTPYGISKLKAEEITTKWCKTHGVALLILRLPLIVGPNPPGNLGDMKKAITKGYYVKINNNPARKSIVVATDVAQLIQRINGQTGIYHLTDGYHPRFGEVEEAMVRRLGKNIKIKLPLGLLRIPAKIGDGLTTIFKKDMPISSLRLSKITATLTFDDTKARKELDWNPQQVLDYIKKHL